MQEKKERVFKLHPFLEEQKETFDWAHFRFIRSKARTLLYQNCIDDAEYYDVETSSVIEFLKSNKFGHWALIDLRFAATIGEMVEYYVMAFFEGLWKRILSANDIKQELRNYNTIKLPETIIEIIHDFTKDRRVVCRIKTTTKYHDINEYDWFRNSIQHRIDLVASDPQFDRDKLAEFMANGGEIKFWIECSLRKRNHVGDALDEPHYECLFNKRIVY